MNWEAYFMINHNAVVHEDLTARCLRGYGRTSYFLASSEKP